MDIDKTLEEVKQTVRREKTRDLKPIPSDFYSTAADAAKNLEAEMMKIGRPRSVEYKMLEDELSGLVTDVETVFMKRAGKVVERATSGAFTNSKTVLLKRDVDKLLPAEQELYEDVLQAILKARATLLVDLADGERDDSERAGRGNAPKGQMPIQKPPLKTAPAASSTRPDAGRSDSSSSKPASAPDTNLINENYVLVRILKDLPEFMGEDKRTYQLQAQDVVELPAANANLLIKRGVAQGITGSSEGNPTS